MMNNKKLLLEYISIMVTVAIVVVIFYLISPLNQVNNFQKKLVDATLGELFLIVFIAVSIANYLTRKEN